MNPTPEQYLLLDIVERGGPAMVPLLICSFFALAVVVERFLWGLRRSRIIPSALLNDIRRLLEKGSVETLLEFCSSSNSALARITTVAIKNAGKDREKVIDALQVTGRQESNALHKNLAALGTIAAISPLLGLLGTVFGMITTFAAIQKEGVGNAPALAGGISEALITTAAGLAIAIPTLIFYRYFTSRAKKLTFEMETIALEITDRLEDNS
jgi:biopolymer transport protein ExbB